MPEMPELQAHAERLTDDFAGIALQRFTPLAFTTLKTVTPGPEVAHGQPLEGVGRRGKHPPLRVGPAPLLGPPMQGGRRPGAERQAPKPPHGPGRGRVAGRRAPLLTAAGPERRAGVWVVVGDPLGQPPLDQLGPDAETVDRALLGKLLHEHPARLHGWLRDQRILAGLGRRLANEICHRAQLSPFASTARLDDPSVDRLHEAIAASIAESLEYERTRDDMSSSAERPGAVHHRTGESCPVCGDTVRAVEYRSYTVNYCPTCQTGGKVLADNTTSRFLK